MTRYCAFLLDLPRWIIISPFRGISVYSKLLAWCTSTDGRRGQYRYRAIIQEVSAEAVSGVQPQAFSSPGKPPARNLVNPANPSRTRLDTSGAEPSRIADASLIYAGSALQSGGGLLELNGWVSGVSQDE